MRSPRFTQNTSAPLQPAVYFIGAGPGDPELLTLRASKIIANADVIVVADSLVPKEILHEVRPDAEIIPLTIARVRANLAVARIHSGDLTLYSAIREQIQALAAANVAYELIPGISAFQAAAAKLGAELTVPELVQTIILTRIGGRASAMPAEEELSSLASHQASLCLYLAARHVEAAESKLLKHYRVGWSDEKIWVVPLEKMAETSKQEALIRTTLYIISPALKEINEEVRSRLYHPDHSHLFRPDRPRSSLS
jgi:precorrin-4/cobalt-precorrin-4 C11-methyltransferase